MISLFIGGIFVLGIQFFNSSEVIASISETKDPITLTQNKSTEPDYYNEILARPPQRPPLQEEGIIEIVKDTNPIDTTTPFNFNLKSTVNNQNFTLYHGQTKSFTLSPNFYTVTEILPPGSDWKVSPLCTQNGTLSTIRTIPNGVEIDLSAGGKVRCVFKNLLQGTITISKETIPPEVGNIWHFNGSGVIGTFSLDTNSASSRPRKVTIGGLLTGEYKFNETNRPADWDMDVTCAVEGDSSSYNTGGSDDLIINLGASDHILCTFKNKRRPRIEVLKYEDVNNNGQEDAGDHRLSGWQMILYKEETLNSWVEQTSLETDSDGLATFIDLEPGRNYQVCEENRRDWLNNEPGSAATTLEGRVCQLVENIAYGQIHPVTFGNYQKPLVSVPAPTGQCANLIDFDTLEFSPYGGPIQAGGLQTFILDGGKAIQLERNGWQKAAFPLTVTPDTIIEFDFLSRRQGEIHAIGFDIDNIQSEDRTFRAYGLQDWGIPAQPYYDGEGWQHFQIRVGDYFTGEMLYLVFANDQDAGAGDLESIFANLGVCNLPKSNLQVTKTVDWNKVDPDPNLTFEFCLTGPSYPTASCQQVGATGGQITWPDLEPGQYTVKETDPGELWTILEGATQTIQIESDTTAQLSFTNLHAPPPPGTITVHQTIDWNGVISGNSVKFKLCVDGAEIDNAICQNLGHDDSHTWTELPPGLYTIRQKNTSPNWTVNIDSSSVMVNSNLNSDVQSTNSLKAGTLIIKKETDIATDLKFEFAPVGFGQGNFFLGNGEEETFTLFPDGGYQISEINLPENWVLNGASCNNSTPSNLQIGPDEIVTCTFSNAFVEPDPGSITVHQTMDWSGATPDPTMTFKVCVEGNAIESLCRNLSHDESYTWSELPPGGYTVSQKNTSSIWMVDIQPTSVTVTSNNNSEVQSTNTLRAGTITIKKQTDIATDLQFEFVPVGFGQGNFFLNSGGEQSFKVLPNSGYQISEINLPQYWFLNGIECSNGSDPSNINVGPDEVVTCSFANIFVEPDPGSITVHQTVDWNGVAPDAVSFEVCVEGTEIGSICENLGHGDNHTWSDLPPGEYHIRQMNTSSIWTVDIQPTPVTITSNNNSEVQSTNTLRVGTITIKKQTDIATDLQFEFVPVGFGQGNFFLNNGGEQSFKVLPDNGYQISEINLPPQWVLSGASCSNGSDLNNINVGPDEIVACTFSNSFVEPDPGSLTVHQTIEWSGATPDNSVRFEVCVEGDDVGSICQNLGQGENHTWSELPPGEYIVNQKNTSTIWTVNINPTPVTVTSNNNSVVQSINTLHPGTITILKQTDIETNARFEFIPLGFGPATFQLGNGEQQTFNLIPGSGYQISENTPTGWELAEASCDNGSSLDNITVEQGQTVTCIFNNRAIPSSITIIKIAELDDDHDFDFSFDSENFQLRDQQSKRFDNLMPGDYTILESLTGRWELIGLACENGSSEQIWENNQLIGATVHLELGQEVICTFTNSKANAAAMGNIEAIPGPSQVEINWNTLSEENTAGFFVMRSTDPASGFAPISGFIGGEGDEFGGDNYQFVDTNVETGITYYYYIQETELDGNIIDHNSGDQIASTTPQ